MTEDVESTIAQQHQKIKVPVVAWIIFIISLLGILGLISFLAIILGYLSVDDPHMKEYYASLGGIDYLKVIINPIVAFVAAFMLIRKKLIAVKLFWAYAFIYVISQIYNLMKAETNVMSFSESGGIAAQSLGLLWVIFLVYYSNRMAKQGLLKP
jgi:hypothetical protein